MCIWGYSVVEEEMEGKEKKRIVVVGGGIGGSVLAYSIQSFADVVLIDQKEYFEIPWSSMRSVVEPSFAERTLVNHIEYLPNVELVVSTATGITESHVLTADGHEVPYDYAVIATGHLRPVPRSRSNRLCQFQSENEKLKSSNSVLIIGGGPTGVELAGEIAVDFPDKRIHLVHSGTRLLEFIGPKASKKALDWLTARNVEVFLDQSINQQTLPGAIIQTSAGRLIDADCYFVCTGKRLTGSSWLQETFVKDSLDLQGRVMVDEHLIVRGHKNIFAIGDITNIDEIKQGFSAQSHALVVAHNLKVLLGGGSKRRMSRYKPGISAAYVSLGRKEALVQYPLLTLSGTIPGRVKSQDLFVGHTRKQLGLQPNLCNDY